jgi:hypothetical protein
VLGSWLLTGQSQVAGPHGCRNTRPAIHIGSAGPLVGADVKGELQTRSQEAPRKRGQSGFETNSLVSFHPPLKKRAKRLQKMGAHLTASEHHVAAYCRRLYSRSCTSLWFRF